MTLTIDKNAIEQIAFWVTKNDLCNPYEDLTTMVKDFFRADNISFSTPEDESEYRRLTIRFNFLKNNGRG